VAQQELSAQAFAQSYFYEVLAGMETLKASGREDWALDKWSNLFYGQLNLSIFRRRLAALTDAALATLRVFAPLALLWFGSLAVLDGTMTLGTMLALTAVATSLLLALASLAGSVQQLQSAAAHLERIDDVMDAAPEQAPRDGGTTPELSGRVELRRVGYRYSTASSWALRDVSVAIEPGQKVAVVGRTGSGKSTLARLLLGLYPPDEGEVLFDGVPLQRLSLRDLRRRFGVVTDEPFLFSGTIRQNIAFNDPGLPDEAVASAARMAQVNDEIRRLPMGYETFVGEGGSALSGGQRQRIAIARAVAHRPSILLLDEATSHLDARTERLVDRELSGLAGTRVVIAHRLSTVRDADLILVMDGGRIVERGTHAALMARGGPYAALVREQQEADRDEPAPAPAARAA
jgi:ABC-type bacteriocin/lantibiotic exporter with double-glycine peptidase domain